MNIMKKSILLFCLTVLLCQITKAANDSDWVQYEPNKFINTGVKNLAINHAMMQISFYSKQTNLDKNINSQPVNTVVKLSIADCSGIIKTKDISEIYYNSDVLVSRTNFDKARAWDYHSPDSTYYQTLKTMCTNTFKPIAHQPVQPEEQKSK